MKKANETLPFKTGKEQDFLAELEELLEKYAGGKWSYHWSGDFFDDDDDESYGLRFTELSVWGFNKDDNE